MFSIEELKAAALLATRGPWTHDGGGGICADDVLNDGYFVAECEGIDLESNGKFIAAANPAAVLELIAALEAARADCRENAARIAELESQRKLAFSACNRWADKFREAEKRVAELANDEVRQRLANAEHQLYLAELAKNNLRASRKAQFRKRLVAERRNAELTDALRQTVSGYKSCLRTGHERIIELGGECDEPEVMIAGNPDIRQAEKVLGINLETGGE